MKAESDREPGNGLRLGRAVFVVFALLLLALLLLLLHGRLTQRKSKFEDMRVQLEQRLSVEPDNPRLWIELAGVCFVEGRYEQAAVSSQRAVELVPESGEGWKLRALALGSLYRQTRDALEREAIAADLERAATALVTLCEERGHDQLGTGDYVEYCLVAQSSLERIGKHAQAQHARDLALEAAERAAGSWVASEKLMGDYYLRLLGEGPQGDVAPPVVAPPSL